LWAPLFLVCSFSFSLYKENLCGYANRSALKYNYIFSFGSKKNEKKMKKIKSEKNKT